MATIAKYRVKEVRQKRALRLGVDSRSNFTNQAFRVSRLMTIGVWLPMRYGTATLRQDLRGHLEESPQENC